jgi:mannosyl-oligosaccharide alpha-1,2-mannosidase
MGLLPPRRALIVIILACTALLLIYQLHDRAASLLQESGLTRPPPSQTTPTHHFPVVSSPNSFWKSRPTHYPLKNLTPVPTSNPKRLPLVQHQFAPEPAQDENVRLNRQQRVKVAFQRCWASYHDRAWMRDELSPISGGGRDTFGGWAASLVDALDTLWIMGLKDEFNTAVSAAVEIDFSTSTDTTINIFETTIRLPRGLSGGA